MSIVRVKYQVSNKSIIIVLHFFKVAMITSLNSTEIKWSN